MEGNEILVSLGVLFGTALAAYVGYFLKAKPPEKTLQIAGALVDADSVKELAAALRAHTEVMREGQEEDEKARALGYRMIERLEKLTDQVEELRRVVGDGANQLARRR